jgi:glycosyltransferase involved in cell wall biosynthesis
MIRYVGVVDHHQKNEVYGQAGCAILPFRREEPFGLVALEAMACGTPVVALARGSLPEIIEPGLTGYLAQNEKEIPELVNMALKLDRAAIRERVKKRFDMSVVAEKYYQLYSKLAAS